MKNNSIFWASLLLFTWSMFGTSLTVEAQCPNCTIVLPAGIPGDTIVVDSLPAAYKNAYYEESMSYRLPYTSNPLVAVAPPGTNVPAGLTIDHFKILSVTGLPPGLSWVGDRPVPMTYDENAPQTRDGCITLCGVAGASGTFIINVNLGIRVGGFDFPSPPLPLEFIVLPDTNASFTLDTSAGCSPFPAVITNLLPSGGNPNFYYFWDFNNGTTSTLENPDTAWYNFGLTVDTTVAITQQVIIDTFPFLLEQIVATVTQNDCNDDILFVTGAPDLYLILTGGGDTINTDPNFQLIGNTQNNSYGPDTIAFPGPIEMGTGTYSLEIWDDDSAIIFDADDQCGNGAITFSTALGAGVHVLTSGDLTVEITISNYIDTVTYVDSVTVSYCNVSVDYIEQVDRTFMVYPNPTSDLVNVKFDLNQTEEEVELIVTDVLGRIVYQEAMQDVVGSHNRQLNLKEQPNGIYMLGLRVGNEMLHRKVILSK